MADHHKLTLLAAPLRAFVSDADSDDTQNIYNKYAETMRLLKITADGLNHLCRDKKPCEPYVEVFIDGTSFPYIDELVPKRANKVSHDDLTKLLRATIKQYLPQKSKDIYINTCHVIVHIYIPTEVLHDRLTQFADDFLNNDPFWTVTTCDAGAVLQHVKEALVVSLADSNCKHILIANRAPDLGRISSEWRDAMISLTQGIPGYVPVNKDSQRVDILIKCPDQACFEEFKEHERTKDENSCNSSLLGDGCDRPDCTYDHSDVTDGILSVIRFLCQRMSCMEGSGCRRINCYLGHACHIEQCFQGEAKHCKFKQELHGVDQAIHHWEIGALRYKKMV